MKHQNPIRVLLVDDHEVVRDGLKALILAHDDMELFGEAQNGEEAVQLCEHVQPDVILMDLVMPNMDGIDTTLIIKERWPQINILVLSSFDERELVGGAIRAGATGYLIKNTSADELATAIRKTAAGQSVLSSQATQALIDETQKRPVKVESLTKREIEILSLLIKGLTNRAIAERLILSQSTIKFHVSNIFSKLGVSSRTEAVALAIKYKITA